MQFVLDHSYLIPLLPLIGAALAGLLGAKLLKGASHWPIWLAVGASAVMSVMLLIGLIGTWHGGHGTLQFVRPWYEWIKAGSFSASAGAFIDPLTVLMLCVVTVVGFLITVFSRGYMAGDSGYFRFFAYMGLFIFAMTILVMGDNFVLLYLGWEGVGLCSYLLIGHYYEKPSAREAAKKAFLVNRIGDFGFAVGIMLIFLAFGTVSFFGNGAGTGTGVLEMALTPATEFQKQALRWIPFLLMLGAFGKSAQFPLYVWLPDAMEGPTPVSALIHAATMVTAGVYMIVRCGTLFIANEAAMWTIAAVGAFTAIFAATIALRQFDLKKVFAYSTISQLGFMFAAAAAMAPVAAIFHLTTHAFFKALLFLSSGVVMHAMLGHLDMRKMSGLKRIMPWTNALILVGCLALSGVPPFAGFFSKDEILHFAFARSGLLGGVLLVTAFLTAYYTFRLYFRVFWGPQVVPDEPAEGHGHGGHGHEASPAAGDAPRHEKHAREPAMMIIPLVVLAAGAMLAGFLNWPVRHESLGGFLGASPSLSMSYEMAKGHYGGIEAEAFGQPTAHDAADGHAGPVTPLMVISMVVAFCGVGLAYLLHCSDRRAAERLASRSPLLVKVLDARYWVDEAYQSVIVEPLRKLGNLLFTGDRAILDRLVDVVGYIPAFVAMILKPVTQRGSLQGYGLWMLAGTAAVLLLIFF